ncbi:hypothetical protein QWJ34_01835 [Saccharibacillus sp. CPCC 101409]|uniref:hypothetical protein n=1 Tax=Saccharibacillus sp. CPCC 101409 TaxID=3058041 RepID=UPI0026728BE6|nr:hypothetical protein [Saccharibacillus sp. CPCC 101409]MDO3408501.1 hypothetical protein [Saccharibacillus sp. CPCC 101409]
MLRTADSETEKRLRGLRKERPNYDAMWNRIRLEADKRNSGWQEHVAEPEPRRPRRRWVVPAACASLALVIALTAAVSRDYWENWSSQAVAAPLGQSIGAQAEAEGIILKLDQAVQGTNRINVEEAEEKMNLNFSLSGFGSEDIRQAAFDKQSITDLDTGKKLSLTMGEFDTNYVQNLDWETGRTLRTSSQVRGEFSELEGLHRYRLELADLYMIRRTSIPIEGKLEEGAEYTVMEDRDFKIKVTDLEWDKKQGFLKIKFNSNGNDPTLDTEDETTLAMDRGSSIILKLGDQEIPVGTSASTNGQADIEAMYNVSKLSPDQLDDMTLIYNYAEPVRKVGGPWIIDFSLDSSQAVIQTETVPILDDSELTEQTGWTMNEAQLDAYGVRIPIDRNADGPVKRLEDGDIVAYGNIVLTDGKMHVSGWQTYPVPGLVTSRGRENEEDSLEFNVNSLAEWNEEYTPRESYDFRNRPLKVQLTHARVAHRDDDHWIDVGIPGTQEQEFSDTLPDGTVITYTVQRKGPDVRVEIDIPEEASISLYEGTRLRVDDKDYAFDPYPMGEDEGGVRDEEGNYNRLDVYRDVPEGRKFELNLGAYGTIDLSKNAEVIISK